MTRRAGIRASELKRQCQTSVEKIIPFYRRRSSHFLAAWEPSPCRNPVRQGTFRNQCELAIFLRNDSSYICSEEISCEKLFLSRIAALLRRASALPPSLPLSLVGNFGSTVHRRVDATILIFTRYHVLCVHLCACLLHWSQSHASFSCVLP